MKYRLQSVCGRLLLLLAGISILPSCSTTLISERGKAKSWPAITNSKTSSKQGSNLVRLMPNKLNETANSVNSKYLSFPFGENFVQTAPLNSDTLFAFSPESPSQESIKKLKSMDETSLSSRMLRAKSSNFRNTVYFKRGSNNPNFDHLQLQKPRVIDGYSTKQKMIPDSNSDTLKWILYVVGLGFLIFLGGYGLLLGAFSIGWGESIIVGVGIFLLSTIPGLFYLWASHLYDGLKEHSKLYRIGFWGTVSILPILFGLPIWIFAAIRDALKNSDTNPLTHSISNFFAWFFLIVGLFIAFLTVLFFIAFAL